MEQDDTRSQTRKSNAIKDFLAQNNVGVFHDLCVLRAKVGAPNLSNTQYESPRICMICLIYIPSRSDY